MHLETPHTHSENLCSIFYPGQNNRALLAEIPLTQRILGMACDIKCKFYLNSLADLLGSLLRCDQPLQAAAHLLREDH